MTHWRFNRKHKKAPEKKCRIGGCKSPFHAKGYCQIHYMEKSYDKPIANTKRLDYYAGYLRRETINKKDYFRFLKIWRRLDNEENMVKHKKSIVEKILRKSSIATHSGDVPI